jgi:hypothetical protein
MTDSLIYIEIGVVAIAVLVWAYRRFMPSFPPVPSPDVYKPTVRDLNRLARWAEENSLEGLAAAVNAVTIKDLGE